jgi:hypothetical protein
MRGEVPSSRRFRPVTMAAAAPALSSADAQRVLKGEIMLAMARDAGATRVDLMDFDYNQNTKATQPQPQSQPAEQASNRTATILIVDASGAALEAASRARPCPRRRSRHCASRAATDGE